MRRGGDVGPSVLGLSLRRAPSIGPLAALLVVAACGEGPSQPSGDEMEIAAAGPVLQFAPPGSATPEPLRVQVRRPSDLAPLRDVDVLWTVVEGAGASLSTSLTTTDSAGGATAVVVLGPSTGRAVVRAELAPKEGASSVLFEAWAVDAPSVEVGPTAPVAPGSIIVLEGANFSPVAEHDVVLFGGVRGDVRVASPTRLEVEVPRCLPPRDLPVTVSLGQVASSPHFVTVSESGSAPAMSVGDAVELRGDAPVACVRLPAGGEYLAVLRSGGTVAGARHGVRLAVLAGSGPWSPPAGAPVRAAAPGPADDVQGAWDRALRARERSLLETEASSGGVRAPALRAPSVPSVGDERAFRVLGVGGRLVDVRAVARHVGATVVFYEDRSTAPGALAPGDYATLARRFDGLVEPVVTGVFGGVPDLDRNGRVVVLLTPEVNRLTPRGSDGFIGGFFYGLDLLAGRTGSNEAEILYAVAPDAEAAFGDARSRDLVMATMPAIFAHELQHMIHFNERMLLLAAPSAEALWLSEGLAQMAEDLVGRAAAARGEGDARLYEAGNHGRARRFLEAAPASSLVIATGSGSLAERGAGWLFLRYLEEQYGGPATLAGLTKSVRVGVANVEAATGRSWIELLGEWGVALYDGSEPGLTEPSTADPRHRYPGLRPRQELVEAGAPYPLPVERMEGLDATRDVEVLPAAPYHAVLGAPPDGTLTVAFGRRDGGATSRAAGVYLRIVRLR